MQSLTPEQQKQVTAIKGQAEVLLAVARNCGDEEAAEDMTRIAKAILERVYVLQGPAMPLTRAA